MKKITFLVCALVALMPFGQALAQSSHDEITGSDPDLEGGGSTFEISSPDGRYKIGFRGHLQQNNIYSYVRLGERHNIDLEINRARFSIYGNVLDPNLTFLFQTGFERIHDIVAKEATNYKAPGTDHLRDYYLNYAADQNYFQLRAGKFRTPFSRQQLMSTSQMQFYTQSEANNIFQLTDTGRDVGLMLHNGFHNPFEWALAAVTQGVVARIGFNHNDIDGYEMVDFTGGDFRFAMAANGFLHTDYKSTKLDDLRGGVDFIAKAGGFSTNGAVYYQYYKPGNTVEHRLGAGLDLGYLINGTVEPVARYSWVKFGDPSPHRHEVLAGLNYYIYGHHLKVQSYGGVDLVGSNWVEWLAGLQLQLAI